ncbi:integrase arm-type DNA-binding domain-containing protein [Pigmentiphaga sp.]|uniref:tyrosine-type recombinase/integrase n=1 Tax=Pigmentiphaga sp. TaxID=1977564 RepID=UPI0025E8A137|nr:integrase arm-type DNA-binding domain-containing protein [Pigmentiphaga sp.]
MGTLAKLADTKVRQAKARERPYKLTDGGGLYLLVTPAGGRYWRYNYGFAGKERTYAIGTYPELSLAKAREEHMAARALVAQGKDPMEVRREQRAEQRAASASSFEVVAREFWQRQLKKGRSQAYVDEVLGKLEKDLFPWLGHRPVAQISSAELLQALLRVETRAEETARRLRGFAGQVFRYAIATARAKNDPSVALKGALATPKGGHFAAITAPDQFAQLLQAMHAYGGEFATRCLLRVSSYLFQRPTEMRLARWDEFDLVGDRFGWAVPMWEIPTQRLTTEGDTKITKTGWETHLVPLPSQVVTILQTLKPLTGRSGFLFESARKPGQPLYAPGARSARTPRGWPFCSAASVCSWR